jgi:hypothetical protein
MRGTPRPKTHRAAKGPISFRKEPALQAGGGADGSCVWAAEIREAHGGRDSVQGSIGVSRARPTEAKSGNSMFNRPSITSSRKDQVVIRLARHSAHWPKPTCPSHSGKSWCQ